MNDARERTALVITCITGRLTFPTLIFTVRTSGTPEGDDRNAWMVPNSHLLQSLLMIVVHRALRLFYCSEETRIKKTKTRRDSSEV